MNPSSIHTLDLNFQGRAHAIASYLVPHSSGVVLVESGPGSTVAALGQQLSARGYSLADITHVLLTHIHLDHAGAAGFLASQGATIYVHPVGAPHLLNPDKLLASAARIYGDQMEMLWGDFLAVPAGRLVVASDGEEIAVGGLRFLPIDTPGHAEHHFAYCFEDLCFTGDVGAVRIPGYRYLRIPMPPPEFHLEKWRASIRRLRSLKLRRIAPTHFGIFDDPHWHLNRIDQALDSAEAWLLKTMPSDPPIDELRAAFSAWMEAEGREAGLSPEDVSAYALANPLGMSADGLQRYWRKVRAAGK